MRMARMALAALACASLAACESTIPRDEASPSAAPAERVIIRSPSHTSADEIAAYLASGEWRGKAGGYAIQGRAEAFVPSINGSWSNVVGLPLATTLDLLRGLGWRPEP